MKILTPLLFKAVFFAVLLLVTLFLLIPLPAGGEPLVNDKVMHGLIFFVLSVLIHRAYPQVKFIKTHAPILAIYGFCIEVVQGLSGYRTFSMMDYVADIIGIVIYIIAAAVMYKIIRMQTANG